MLVTGIANPGSIEKIPRGISPISAKNLPFPIITIMTERDFQLIKKYF